MVLVVDGYYPNIIYLFDINIIRKVKTKMIVISIVMKKQNKKRNNLSQKKR